MQILDQASLEQLKQIFIGSLSSDRNLRDQANEALDQIKAQPDLDKYLLHILVEDQQSSSNIRASAGLMLKNDILKSDFTHTRSKELQIYILDNIVKGLLDQNILVRNITGNVVTALFQIYGVIDWPQILGQLLELANGEKGNDRASQEGAISALAKICEDSAVSLDRTHNGQVPSEVLIPQFLQLMNHESQLVVSRAIICINQFIALRSQQIVAHFDEILAKFFALTALDTPDVRKNICTAFCLILDKFPFSLAPHVQGITDFCIHTIQVAEEEVALEACEFLLGLATSSTVNAGLDILIPKMVPVLLDHITYSKNDILMFEQLDRVDAHIEDRDEDIRPTNAQTKEKIMSNQNDDSDDEDDEDDDDPDTLAWNLRKCSAATLDVLAQVSPVEVLQITFPILQEKTTSAEWPIREAAILAFGAVSEACLEVAVDKVPEIVPFLAQNTTDPQPRVRQIACWALGRYSPWICAQALENNEYSNYYGATLDAVMAGALDAHKSVQQSGMSALDSLVDNSDYSVIAGLVEPLLSHFKKCFEQYQRRNLMILYGTIQTFIEKVGDIVASRVEYVEQLLPPLLTRWEFLNDADRDLWPLLECMASVAASLGSLFAPYAPQTYARSLRILQTSDEADFIITAIDLIDGLVQGLQGQFAELVATTNIDVMQLIIRCLDNPIPDIRQSSFALLGDMSISVMHSVILPYLPIVMSKIITEINDRSTETSAVCNNAAWTLGEMALVLSNSELTEYLNPIVDSLIGLLKSEEYEQTVIENAAIALGRLGTSCAQELALRLPEFAFKWCKCMESLDSNEEKESSFKGMCSIIEANPQGLQGTSLAVFEQCASNYVLPGEDLRRRLQRLSEILR